MPKPEKFTGTFNTAQSAQLLAPIKPHRVLKDGKDNSHVSHQDVVAHLTRVFGFGNWMTELLDCSLVFERCREEKPTESHREKWDVCYRAAIRLTIFDEHHNLVTFFEDASMGDALNLTRADAHDLAMKSAISTALKRCAKNMGDQFGLSLYNKGQMTALIGGSLVLPPAPKGDAAEQKDLQEHASEQVSLGVDETEFAPEATREQEAALQQSLGAQKVGSEEPTEADQQAMEQAEEPEAVQS